MSKILTIVHDHAVEIKHGGDALNAGVFLGVIVELLPSVYATVFIVWTLIRIYETKTVQRCIKKLRNGKDK